MEMKDFIIELCIKLGLDRDGDTVIAVRRPAISGSTNAVTIFIHEKKGIIKIMD